MTTIVRRLDGTPPSSSSPGSRVAANRFVAPQFTSAMAASDAGMTPSRASTAQPHVTVHWWSQANANPRTNAVTTATTPI